MKIKNILLIVSLSSSLVGEDISDQSAQHLMYYILGEYERADSNIEKSSYYYSKLLTMPGISDHALKGYIQLLSLKKKLS